MTIQELNQPTTRVDNTLINKGLQLVEDEMFNVVSSEVKVLRDASQHILSAGGKRVRPRLVLLSYLANGGTDVAHVARPAAAVELIHTASVVHDDINDHGVVRRGQVSVNARWGRTFALLTGDFLFTAVYELMAPYGTLNVDLARAATALVEGETLQAAAVKNNEFTRENYARIIGLKTAALFQAATEIGAKLADASEEVIDAIGQYGYNIGLAFQIIDDVLDIVGDEEQLGKTAGIDLDQGRGFVAVQDNGSDPMTSIKRKVISGDYIQEAQQQAEALAQLAVSMLDVLPDNEAKDELIALADKVVNRNC
jgi:octaprenyl-diphosphate synthase